MEVAAMSAQAHHESVRVGPLGLPGEWTLPPQAVGEVVFVHGSGSGRGSPRNRFVAGVLQQQRLATLLFDLLSEDEARDRRRVFDIALLTQRLLDAMEWLRRRHDESRVGLFGASTGAAAALQAATERPGRVGALVLRGGRVDLAPRIARVQAPTMLIVGGADVDVMNLNRVALNTLQCAKRLEIVPGASHLFEEPGALDAVAHLAAHWFIHHLARQRQ
jgi:pimeloyl-ACP methyl ester carboxylesterase